MAAYNPQAGSYMPGSSFPVALSAEDQLVAQETALFGPVSEYEEVGLPPPPYDPKANNGAGPNGLDANGKRINSNSQSARAKRPKIAKPDPNRGNKVTARRSMVTANGQIKLIGQEGDIVLPNNDYCEACHSKGQFLCCEGGCLRSFHFNCLDAPVDLEDLPDESWFCKACRAEHDPPLKFNAGIFRELIYQIDCTNPKAFSLPVDIKTFFLEVTAGAGGDFIDTREHRLPSKVTQRGSEDRDGFRARDKSGKTLLCYQCNESASLAKHRRIVSCDFCDQNWHLDCLDPPMSGMPPPTRKWMCPVHSDHTLPKIRHTKNITTINVTKRFEYNNGDISIIPRREREKILDEFDELTVNRIRYQVPEDTVILDFWGRAQNGFKPRTISAPVRKSLFDQFEPVQRPSASSQYSGGGSPLTSLGDLSDTDSPACSHARHHSSARLDTSALDDLALLADGYYSSMHFESEATAAPAAATTEAGPSITDSPGLATNKITIKIGARSSNGSAGPASIKTVENASKPVEISDSPTPAPASNSSATSTPAPLLQDVTTSTTIAAEVLTPHIDKGKGREIPMAATAPAPAAPSPAVVTAPTLVRTSAPKPAPAVAPVPAAVAVPIRIPAPSVAPVAAAVPIPTPRPTLPLPRKLTATPIPMSTSPPTSAPVKFTPSFRPPTSSPGTIPGLGGKFVLNLPPSSTNSSGKSSTPKNFDMDTSK